jgi:hypothetical protein
MTAVLSFQAAQYPADTRHAPHEHAALQLSLVLAGRVVETVGRVTEHAGALSVVCKAAGVVHANVFGREGARLARLTLADGDLASLLDDPARASDWRWTHDPAVAAPFLRLVQHATTRAATRDSTCDTTRDTTGDTTIAADDPDLLDLLAAFSARPVRPRSGEAPADRGMDATDDRRRNRPSGWGASRLPGRCLRRVGQSPSRASQPTMRRSALQ